MRARGHTPTAVVRISVLCLFVWREKNDRQRASKKEDHN